MIAWLGVGILPYLVVQAIYGYWILEVVNYMEHYGMLRQKVGVGERQRYERVDPSHSWNSNNIATNVLLYHLQRHSDHHANPTRRYQTLRDYQESPVLPTGYAGMIVLAIVPAVWRRVMDPRVLHHFDGDLSRASRPQARQDPTHRPRTRSWSRPRAVGRAGRRGRGARRAVPGLWLRLRRRGRRRARGLRGRDGLAGRAGQLVLPRLRSPRQDRLHPAGPGACPMNPGT
jgi:alkane 1-monooxygenase